MESHQNTAPPHSNESETNISHLFSREVQDKIAAHPCYSKDAHQYARMHLPVAPACNIQCNYCNRKYDCSNESRPGVVSRLVDPPQALKQYQAIKKRAPNLTVMGIAGPGDALANPQATFETMEKIKAADPSVQLCISTNGLMLEPHVDRLAQLGVDHLTITINCIDPEVGAKIYPWIYFNYKRLRGIEASKTLISQQMKGLEAAAKAGMMVKVNTVLIPGVNDHHIEAVSAAVKQRGALLHNIMPLISDPAHGTYFGLTGQRGPTEEEIQRARAASGDHMPQMTHCQQCRADAVGTLGGCSSTADEQRSCGSTESDTNTGNDGYQVAVASDGSEIIKTHFGHAKVFEVYRYSDTSQQFNFIEERNVAAYCNGQSECLENEDEKEQIINTVADCQLVLSARMGIAPWRQLEKLGVTPNVDFAMEYTADALKQIALHITEFDSSTQHKEALHEVCHNG
ncbi:nitrogenase cofactor biosynthesis protein NifB [Vibrio sp. RC27]